MDDNTLAPSPPPANQEERLPLVSVCIPVYNCARYIGEAVDSVLRQTLQDFEVIVCDNCSTDDTWRVLQGYHDPRLRIFRNETNVGPWANFNKVMSLARGKYIKLLCADDVIYPDCLQVQADVLEDPANDSVAVVFCRRDIIDPSGKRLMSWGYPGPSRRRSGTTLLRKCLHYSSNLLGEPMCALFRSRLAPMAGGYRDIRWSGDLYYYARLFLFGDGYVLAKPHCAFRLSAQSGTLQEAGQGAKLHQRAFADFIALLRTDPELRKLGIRKIDALIAWVMIRITTRLRRIVYRRAA